MPATSGRATETSESWSRTPEEAPSPSSGFCGSSNHSQPGGWRKSGSLRSYWLQLRKPASLTGAPGVKNEPPSAQEAAEMDPTSGVSDLTLVADEVLTPGDGLRGVHSVFRYRVGDGPMQMMDQTAYLNDDASKLYMFFVRCSTECYEQRQKEIGNVVSSFTVRETT